MKTTLRVLAIAYVVYLAIAILIVMPALNFLPPWYVKKTYDRDLSTELVYFNPFTLSLEVRKAELPERDGERFVGLNKASVNVSLESLWGEGLVFDRLQVQDLFVHVRRLENGEFNFSDLLPAEDTSPQEPDSEAGLPGVTIEDLDFHSQSICYTDATRPGPYQTHLDQLAVRVTDLSTVIKEGQPYHFRATDESGGSIEWEGEVSIPRSHSKGRLTLSDLGLHSAWRFAEPMLQFELVDGRLHIDGQYELTWADEPVFDISQGSVRLTALDIQPKQGVQLQDTAVELTELSLTGIAVNSGKQHADIAAITVDGLGIDGWSEGEQISLLQLFEITGQETGGSSAAPTAPDPNQASAAEPQWTATISRVRLQNSRIGWRSEFTDPALMQVTGLEAGVDELSWPLSGDSPLFLKLGVNDALTLAVDGTIALAEGNGTINYDLQDLPLAWFNPNLPAPLNAEITHGALQVAGSVALAQFVPQTILLDGDISDFAGRIEQEENSLTSWDTVRWEGLAVNMDERSVVLQKLALDNYAGRLHIHEDGSINAQKVWRAELAGDEGEGVDGSAQETPAPEPAAPGEEQPWSISIPAILITDSKVDFMDQSLPIAFRAMVGDVNGDILGLSSAPGAQAKVDIKGSVDGYAPVKLKGTAAPLSEPPAIDLRLTFDGVDLATLSPYSATYAGYAIERGLLDLDLKYALQDNRLAGHNSVIVDQLKLGDKIDSDKALDLPLKLALALLTDSNGVIDLQVPVSGNVDDPQFEIGGIIIGAFINLITKAITAPFTLLAGLVNSDEDLHQVNFASGSAEVDEANHSKLQQLHDALMQRPELKLVINGRLNLAADKERLQKNALKAQLVEAGLSPQEVDDKGTQWEKAVQARYQALTTSADDALADAQPTVREQYLAVAHSIAITDAQMLELAQQRAVAVKNYMVTTLQLDPERAVIDQASLDPDANAFSGAELGVDA